MRPHRPEARRLAAALACAAMLYASVASAAPANLGGRVELSPAPLDRRQAVPSLAVLGMSGQVLVDDSLAFMGGYDPADWSGVLHAVALNADGTTGDVAWDAGALLTDPLVTSPIGRTILSARQDETGDTSGIAFESTAHFDDVEERGLMRPEPELADDTLAARVDYLRGARTGESGDAMRVRGSLLGALVHAQATYVAAPGASVPVASPRTMHGESVPAPELDGGAQRYADFLAEHAGRPPVLYVAANDGMLHAFHAPLPRCKARDEDGRCTTRDPGAQAGREMWAYVPRAVYGNLGHLTQGRDFTFQPTVDATPVTRDVFFAERGKHEWRTLLVGGLRLGGRGVYALDITEPAAASQASPERTVLWEFDADAPPGVTLAGGAYRPADLGYTYGQPAIARLANGRWAVLVPGGYFPDCSKPDQPLRCDDADAPPGYGALFVLDAQTGAVIAELSTRASIDGVRGHGLTTPVLGDYDGDQVDDVAFAGDLAGNLWRFDLSSPHPADWNVTLAFRPAEQGARPITVMPRLFPDPMTNRFIVVFGTGKYLGSGDKTDVSVQAVYGIRDKLDASGKPATVMQAALQPQTLGAADVVDPSGAGEQVGLRSGSSNPVPMEAGGWRIDLDLVAGERVVTTPTALFDTHTVLISTLIPHGDTPYGALLALDAASCGARAIVAFGGASYAGALLNHPPIAGPLPAATQLGGGKRVLPGVQLKGGQGGLDLPLSLDSPLWRRRSWSLLTPDS
jgi:type IV pilus assembly protein PilY1